MPLVTSPCVPVNLVNHWTHLPEWWPGRRLWVFYVTYAGQPELHNFRRVKSNDDERQQAQKEEKLFKKGKIIGRSED